MTDERQEAGAKLQEIFTSGQTSYNAPIPIGETIPYENRGVHRSFWEVMGATAEQTLKTLPTAQLQDEFIRQEVEEQGQRDQRRKLSPAEANQLYPFMSRPFSEDVDSGVAEILAQRQLEIQELQSIIDGGSKGALVSGTGLALQFSIGMFDPINVVTGMGLGKAVGAVGSRLGVLGASGGVMRQAAYGAAGNLLQEPLNAGFAANLQEDYDPVASTAYTMALGAGLPVAVAVLAKGGSWASQRLKGMMRSAPRADAIAQQAAISEVISGKQVTAGNVVKDVMAERANPPALPPEFKGKSARIKFEYEPITQPRDYNGRAFFVGADLANYDLASSSTYKIERNYGGGVYMTDSPFVANGYAGSKYGSGQGGIFEVNLTKENPNVIDLNKGLPKKAATVLEALWDKWRPSDVVRALSTEDGKLKDTTPAAQSDMPSLKGKSGQEIFDLISDMIDEGKLPDSVFDQLSESLSAVGFDGYRFDGNAGASPHNVVMLFDNGKTGTADGKIQDMGAMMPSKTKLPQHTLEDLQRRVDELSSIKSDALYDDAAHQKIDTLIRETPKEVKIPDAEAELTRVNEELKSAKDQGQLTRELELENEKIDEELAKAEAQDAVTKSFLFCSSRSE